MFGLYLKNVDFTCRFFEAVFSDQSEIHFGQRLVRTSEYSLQFLKIVIFFFERNEPEAGFFTVRFICFEDVCRNNNKKNAVCWFSCVQTWLCWCHYPSGLLCLLKGELQSVLHSMFYASVTLHTWKNRTTFSTSDNIPQNAEDGVFCYVYFVEVYYWDLKLKLLSWSFSKNGIFQHLFHFCW